MIRTRWMLVSALSLGIACVAAADWRKHHDRPESDVAPRASRVSDKAPAPAKAEPRPVATVAPSSARVTSLSPSNEPSSRPPGMVVAIDPETGELTSPTVEQLRELFPPGTSVAQTPEGFVVTHRPDGSVSVDVGSQLQEYSFVRIGPDGRQLRGCASRPPDPRALESLPPAGYEER